MTEAFDLLINSTKPFEMIYFSDDSCVSLLTKDRGRVLFNLDISSCDSSHTEYIFKILQYIADGNSNVSIIIRTCIAQCRAILRIKSYSGLNWMVAKLRPKRPVLYSGSSATTGVNNVSELVIFSCIVDRILREGLPNYSDCRNFLKNCAEDAGYIVTIEGDGTAAQLQFLKHSPVLVDGRIVPVLNIGVILRMFGSCYGELPGTKNQSLGERAYAWNRQLVLALAHAGNYQALNTLREFYGAPSVEELENKNRIKVAKLLDHRSFCGGGATVSNDDVALRYNLQGWQLDELFESLHPNNMGYTVETIASRKILEFDYGYKF